jgi:hypothetical protein
VATTKEANLTVDAGVLQKFNEAKRCCKAKKKKQDKKFKLMFFAKFSIKSVEWPWACHLPLQLQIFMFEVPLLF